MSSHIENFIGLPFYATIGEPWDFTSTAGDNKIQGRVIGSHETKNHGLILLCEISKFNIAGKDIYQVIAVNRYKGSQAITIDVAKGKGLGMNFVFPVSGKELSVSDLPDFLDGDDEKSFIVGTFIA